MSDIVPNEGAPRGEFNPPIDREAPIAIDRAAPVEREVAETEAERASRQNADVIAAMRAYMEPAWQAQADFMRACTTTMANLADRVPASPKAKKAKPDLGVKDAGITKPPPCRQTKGPPD
eukprot:jgi/Botrbrau1/17542/Bobra.0864s0001.1